MDLEKIWSYVLKVISYFVLFFLILPILIMIPLSFNAEPFFSFTKEMLTFQSEGYSLKWYKNIFENELWMLSIKNSFIIGILSTILATVLGILGALGINSKFMNFKSFLMAVVLSPMIVPLIISAAGMYFFYTYFNLTNSFTGVIIAHTALGIPFVVITVSASLANFDFNLVRASYSLGANPLETFFKVTFPIVRPGIISGALFAFITSFDEVVVIMFLGSVEQKTIPWQMFSGIREQISPTILSVATILICSSITLLVFLELLRRRNERLRS